MSKTSRLTEYLNSRKVELSSEQVNLALVDDIAKMTQQAVSISKELQDSTDMADKLQNELNLQIQKVKKLYPQASKFQDAEDKLWDKATKAASDLGIDRNSIKGFKEFSDIGVQVNSAINSANKYMS